MGAFVFGPMGLAGISILLWSALAAMSRELTAVPPLLLVGLTLGIGSLLSLNNWRSWFQDRKVLAFGTVGIFGYHLLLFLALRYAPPVEANLINYTWPILMTLLAPILLPTARLHWNHLAGACLAFIGAAVAIGGQSLEFDARYLSGYGFALAAALIWAIYSVITKRLGTFPSSAVGGFCFFSSLLALLLHWTYEDPTTIPGQDWALIVAAGVGPLGLAFYSWDAALKQGDPRKIGALSYLTPLLSTAILAIADHGHVVTTFHLVALIFIVGGAWLSNWTPRRNRAEKKPAEL